MKKLLLDILVCPACKAGLTVEPPGFETSEEIINGALRCENCSNSFPIVNRIPRFVPPENYATSFGFQWNTFKTEQLDSVNGSTISEDRFYSVTEWQKSWMDGKLILDAGCGAGRFLDISSRTARDVVGIDLSNAVDASLSSLSDRANVHLVQASLYDLPFRSGTFDGTYCIGVVQHTPDPKRSLECLGETVKPAGRLGLFIYERRRWTMLYSKYLLRPLTKRLSQKSLLFLIKVLMPVLFPLTEVLFRIPRLGRVFMFMIPVSNYVGENTGSAPKLDMKQRYQWAIMDTFDMMAPAYDSPMTLNEVHETLGRCSFAEIRRTSGIGLCIDAIKDSDVERPDVSEPESTV